MSLIKMLLSQFAKGVTAIGVGAVAAALLAYLRAESSAGIKWLFYPLARRLPWNHMSPQPSGRNEEKLSSELTIANVFLTTADGRSAKYEKAGDYVVNTEPLHSYYEGVTASGTATGFSTELGVILQTTTEHGFFVSRIDLGSVFEVGTRFRNVYRVQLDDCFVAEEEHWTQEIAVPTKHLTLRVHFPSGRPPTLIRSKQIMGLAETEIAHGAGRTELFGQPAIVWEIENPNFGDIYKVEWRW